MNIGAFDAGLILGLFALWVWVAAYGKQALDGVRCDECGKVKIVSCMCSMKEKP